MNKEKIAKGTKKGYKDYVKTEVEKEVENELKAVGRNLVSIDNSEFQKIINVVQEKVMDKSTNNEYLEGYANEIYKGELKQGVVFSLLPYITLVAPMVLLMLNDKVDSIMLLIGMLLWGYVCCFLIFLIIAKTNKYNIEYNINFKLFAYNYDDKNLTSIVNKKLLKEYENSKVNN